jgi:hypothetical protein
MTFEDVYYECECGKLTIIKNPNHIHKVRVREAWLELKEILKAYNLDETAEVFEKKLGIAEK